MLRSKVLAVFIIGLCLAMDVSAQENTAPSILPSGVDAAPIPVSTDTSASATGNAAAALSESTQLAEVVVTANKRSENVRKISGSITALTGKQLKDMGAQSFGDYLSTVPGVQFDETSPQQSLISMRGITTSTIPQENQSPVGIFFEDVSMTDPVDVVLVPDFDTFDMARVEVMRGPQGALYGSDALGGAINFVPNHTDLQAFGASLNTEVNRGRDNRLGENAKGMVNIPLFRDIAGLRVVGYERYAPGYIDNLGVGVNDANDHIATGGRVLGDWKLSPGTTLALTGLVQYTHQGDQDYSVSSLPRYQSSTTILQSSRGRLNVDDLRLDSDLGFAKFVAIASYQYKQYHSLYDLGTGALESEGIGASLTTELANLIATLPTGALEEDFKDNLHGYSGELRLVSPSAKHFEWLAGVSYSDRRELFGGGYQLANLPESVNNLILTLEDEVKAVELAGFADLTYKFNSHWKIAFGGREYRNTVPSVATTGGAVALASYQTLSATAPGLEKDTGFNPRASLSWSPNNSDLFYFLYSHGFSLGGSNLNPQEIGITFPKTYGSNKLLNFELGAKTAWFDHRLFIDVTPYYIYWKDIPLEISKQGFPVDPLYLDNVGNAHSYGVEMAVTAKLLRRLTLTNTATWSHAILADSYDPGDGAPVVPYGTPLPGTPRWQFSNLLTYALPLGSFQFHASALNRFIGPSLPSIQAPSLRVGNYDLLGVRAGIAWHGLGLEAFVNNALNRFAVTTENYSVGNASPFQYPTHPRVVGLDLTWTPE